MVFGRHGPGDKSPDPQPGGRLRIKRGSGELHFRFLVNTAGELHISFYSTEGGHSFASLYYASTPK